MQKILKISGGYYLYPVLQQRLDRKQQPTNDMDYYIRPTNIAKEIKQ